LWVCAKARGHISPNLPISDLTGTSLGNISLSTMALSMWECVRKLGAFSAGLLLLLSVLFCGDGMVRSIVGMVRFGGRCRCGRGTGALVGLGGRGMKVGMIGIAASGLAQLFAMALSEALGIWGLKMLKSVSDNVEE
jgi:hypothetical protein